MTIQPADTHELIEGARELFREYSTTIGNAVCFVEFAREVVSLPGRYGPPGGRLWVVVSDTGTPVACVAVRALEEGVCEMKRLYVREQARGTGLGRRLVDTVIEWARAAGYGEIRLDTLPSMEAATRLYESLGFRHIPPYGPNPTPGAVHFSLALV